MITNWTDEDMHWDDLSGRITHRKYVQAIRLALLERMSCIHEDIGSLPHLSDWGLGGSKYPPEENWSIGTANQALDLVDYLSGGTARNVIWGIQYYIDEIIPLFCNHHDEANWHHSAAGTPAPKVWTEPDLMTHLGQTRIRFEHDARYGLGSTGLSSQQFTAAWLRQQYDIINQLRWMRVHYSFQGKFFSGGATVGGKKFGQVDRSTWADAKAAAESAWTASSLTTQTNSAGAPRQSTRSSYNVAGPDYNAQMYSNRNSVSCTIMHRYAADVDFYGLVEGLAVPDKYNLSAIDVWHSIGTTTITKAAPGPPNPVIPSLSPAIVFSPLFGSLTMPSPWLDEPTEGANTYRGWHMTDYACAVKYDQDSTNGFQFLP